MRVVALFSILAVGFNFFGPQRKDLTSDDSDWWSLVRPRGQLLATAKSEEPPIAAFTIAGIDLGPSSFGDVIPKLGAATIVMRGEQAQSREQLCYRSNDGATRLIFEKSEEAESFYLVGPAPDWYGSSFCEKSSAITSTIATANGLRLGLTMPEVEQIMGAPSGNTPSKSEWLWTGQFPLTADQLRRIRQRQPDLELKDSDAKSMTHNISAVLEVTYTDGRVSEIGAWYSFDDSEKFED
ncbi:MAG TPA: hypothetical protein VMA09_09310 [Candidatus Binataceae bacterium]|nr:hypothetical protein [Candidatus Binataceae bacterium]